MAERKPSCIGEQCVYYDRHLGGCDICAEDVEAIRLLCPCENGEYEELFAGDSDG